MAADSKELREILESNIGEVYKNAFEAMGDAAAAKDITRRVMVLLKRTHEAGLSVTPEMVKRLTDDCCREQACYDSKKAAFKDGIIADMPDFDTAISSITEEEVRSKARSDAENKAMEAYQAMKEAKALGAAVVSPEPEEADAARSEGRAAERDGKKYRPVYDDDEYDDDDDDEYDDDDDDDDEDYEPLFEKKAKAPVLTILGIWILIIALAFVAFCLVIMLMQRNVLPGGASGFVQKFMGWFNANLFPLF